MTLGGEGQFGRKQTEETKEKLRLIQINKIDHHFYKTGKNSINYGRKLTQEHKDKISKKSTGRGHTKESKEKMKLSKIGNKNPQFGKATHNSLKVLVNDVTYRSLTEAGRHLGIGYQTVKRRILNNDFPNYNFVLEI